MSTGRLVHILGSEESLEYEQVGIKREKVMIFTFRSENF